MDICPKQHKMTESCTVDRNMVENLLKWRRYYLNSTKNDLVSILHFKKLSSACADWTGPSQLQTPECITMPYYYQLYRFCCPVTVTSSCHCITVTQLIDATKGSGHIVGLSASQSYKWPKRGDFIRL